MRERAAQELSPKMGRMGAEDPSKVPPSAPQAEPPKQKKPALRIQGVRKSYGQVVAVAGVDLVVDEGEFFTLLGPSGSGKTTLLRLIAGFERPDSGRIELGGKDVTAVPPYARATNTVFQDYALFPHMSVAANIEYGLKVRHLAREDRRRLHRCIERHRPGWTPPGGPPRADSSPGPGRNAGPGHPRGGRHGAGRYLRRYGDAVRRPAGPGRPATGGGAESRERGRSRR